MHKRFYWQQFSSFLAVSLLLLVSCNEEKCRTSKVEAKPLDIKIERLEKTIFNAKSEKEILKLLNQNQGFAVGFLDSDQYPSQEIVASRFYNLIQEVSIDTLYREVQDVYENLSKVESQLSDAYGRLAALYPQTRIPKFQSVVTGIYKDLSFSDSLIVIGLDHFLGSEAKYKPLDTPDYIYRRYDKNHMAAIIMSFVAGQYNSSNFSDKTLLAEMIDYGKTYYLVGQLMPCVSEHVIIGFTEKEMNDSRENDDIIWANLIENELLYEVDHVKKNKLIGERPNVFEIGENCPGRIGRWVGWQIVKAYMEQNPDVTIQDLMATSNAQLIFEKSRYKPKN